MFDCSNSPGLTGGKHRENGVESASDHAEQATERDRRAAANANSAAPESDTGSPFRPAVLAFGRVWPRSDQLSAQERSSAWIITH